MYYGYGYGLYFDEPWVIVLLMITMLFAGWAQIKVNSTFNKYSKVKSMRGKTGADAAMEVLRQNAVNDVKIERVSGHLSDHFDPRTNTIRLSDSVYASTSVAAIGVAAHEAGHAVQYAENYAPMKLRASIIPITQIGSKMAMPLIILGLFLTPALTTVGILLFSTVAVFQLVTLPVEFDASRRAIRAFDNGSLLSEDEVRGAKKTLTAAALTYVAALAVAVINLLRIIVRYGGRRND